mmetsp:Transcript_33357/g.48264  ORF Transcript_33357/g.48264 Transcript_33357/m.48264 type:complete len:101 (-) Transcript_33357:3-305(-)
MLSNISNFNLCLCSLFFRKDAADGEFMLLEEEEDTRSAVTITGKVSLCRSVVRINMVCRNRNVLVLILLVSNMSSGLCCMFGNFVFIRAVVDWMQRNRMQ